MHLLFCMLVYYRAVPKSGLVTAPDPYMAQDPVNTVGWWKKEERKGGDRGKGYMHAALVQEPSPPWLPLFG